MPRLPPPGGPRLLLLDEVAAHLDPLRRAALFERLREGAAQVWLTGTELAPFAAIEAEAAVWRVSGGTVERCASPASGSAPATSSTVAATIASMPVGGRVDAVVLDQVRLVEHRLQEERHQRCAVLLGQAG